MAAKEAESFVYYIIVDGYSLNEVHTLNLNQKNWTKKDFMEGYANMGIESYIKLKNFFEKNNDFNLSDCIAFCQNIGSGTSRSLAVQTSSIKLDSKTAQIFEKGTWRVGDMNFAQDIANKLRMLKPYFTDYNKTVFVGTMITLFNNQNFDFNEFFHKVRIQPTKIKNCTNRDEMKILIEDIYNYRSRNKINLRY